MTGEPATKRAATVIGGGVAGIVAALGLRERGFRVRLIESRGWLGGRAFSFDDRGRGVSGPDGLCDNGPHVMLGCYDAMRRLLRRLGTEGGFAAAPSLALRYWGEGGRRWDLALGRLPTPMAMPWGLMKLPLGAGGRARGLWGLGQVLRGAPADMTLGQWLDRRGQRGAVGDFLWIPLCRAVMNAEPEQVSARLFLATLRQAFTGSAARAAIWIPARPWLDLVGVPARRMLEGEGVEVSTGVRVGAVADDGAGGSTVHLAGGERLEVPAADALVMAVPWHGAARLLGQPAERWRRLEGLPIVSVYFRCADDAAPESGADLVALVGGAPFHFLCRTPGAAPGRFALLAGAAQGFDGQGVADIERIARRQLAAYDPSWHPDTPADVRVVKESRATITAAPGALDARPEPGRHERNVFVCGDWADVGLPSTLEGAARSGEAVVAAVAGRP